MPCFGPVWISLATHFRRGCIKRDAELARLRAEVVDLRRGDSPCVDDDGTPFASARHWRAANREAVRRLAEARAEVADLRTRLAVSVSADRWSYCPFCGLSVPRPGLHPDGCPGQEMQRAAYPPEKP